MIDIKLLRNEYESVSKNIAKREKEYPALIQFKEIDKK
jgi:seryl-tRNA synthetase